MHECVHGCMRACLHACVRACALAYMHAYVCLCILALVCLHMCMRVCLVPSDPAQEPIAHECGVVWCGAGDNTGRNTYKERHSPVDRECKCGVVYYGVRDGRRTGQTRGEIQCRDRGCKDGICVAVYDSVRASAYVRACADLEVLKGSYRTTRPLTQWGT